MPDEYATRAINCVRCGVEMVSGEDVCPLCRLTELCRQESQIVGRIYSFSVVHRGMTMRFAAQAPYVLALVDVEPGLRLLSNIVDSPLEQIAIGSRVTTVLGEDPDGQSIVQFRLVEGSE